MAGVSGAFFRVFRIACNTPRGLHLLASTDGGAVKPEVFKRIKWRRLEATQYSGDPLREKPETYVWQALCQFYCPRPQGRGCKSQDAYSDPETALPQKFKKNFTHAEILSRFLSCNHSRRGLFV